MPFELQGMGRLFTFLQFYFSAATLHGVHSPFIFDFCKNILDDKRHYYAFKNIEQLRRSLLSEKKKIRPQDFGAGSKVAVRPERSIAGVAKTSATHPFFGRLLFKMVHHYKPATILELGSSLGLGSLYLAQPAVHQQFITIEGDPETAKWAQLQLNRLQTKRSTVRQGTFDTVLPEVLTEIPGLDFLFVDGHHQKAPTLRYFELCLDKARENSIFIFDDIYWSKDMQAAWQQIKNHPRVTTTIDLYQFGIVFFRKDFKTKQHLKLVPLRWKPWRVW